MDTQLIQQQVEAIAQRDDVSESLTCLCELFLSMLDNLKGNISDVSFLKTLDITCSTLESKSEKLRIATVLDVLLTTSLYYQKARLYLWRWATYHVEFSLLLWETYNHLMDWYEEETDDSFDRIFYSDNFFKQFTLETRKRSYSRFNLWRNAIKAYRIVLKHDLIRLDSRMKDAFERHRREMFLCSHPLIGGAYSLIGGLVVLSGSYVLLSILHFFYQFYVQKPYYLLLAGAGLREYRAPLGELSIAHHAFWERGLFVLWEPLSVFLSGILVLLLINFVQEKWEWKILFPDKIRKCSIKNNAI